MSGPALILGGVSVPMTAALDLSQTYEPIGGSTLLRMASGAAVKLTHWQKLSTQLSGGGWIPAGLQDLDYSAPLTLSCIAPRAVLSATNTATLPAARRTDSGAEPYAFALLVDGTPVNTTCSVVGNAATAGAVTGAARYVFNYYPELSVYATPPQESFDAAAGSLNWTLTAEEV